MACAGKANIDHVERSLIQSEVKNNFLARHFTDDKICKRDGGE